MRELTRNFEPFDPRWRVLQLACLPSPEEAAEKLREIDFQFGGEATAFVLGVSGVTVQSWLKRGRVVDAAGRRLVWIIWHLMYEPERVSSFWEIATSFRFTDNKLVEKLQRRKRRRKQRKTPQQVV